MNGFDPHTTPLPPGIHAIEASAGTGKTHTLAELVVRLVTEMAVPLEQILVVTFTRAAAAELRERIFRHLANAYHQALTGSNPENNPIAERLAHAKAVIDQATIATIDSFVATVARELGWAVGVASDAQLIEDEAAFDQPIVDRLWQEATKLPPELAAEVGSRWPSPDHLRETFARVGSGALFREPRNWDEVLHRWQAIEHTWPVARRQALAAAAGPIEAAFHARSADKLRREVLAPLAAGRWPTLEEPLLDYLQGKLTQGRTLTTLLSRKQLAEWHALADTLPELRQTRADLVTAWFQRQYRAWLTERQERLQAQNGYTYASLKRAVAEAVVNHPSVAAQLRRRYHACLIDEFQDTDPDQWQLFHTLFRPTNEQGRSPSGSDENGRWLFLIGDPKQAIYGFRGANLETYFAARACATAHHTLTVNYRSHPRLIDAFNALFAEPDEASAPAEEAGKAEESAWESPSAAEHLPFLDARCRYRPVTAGRNTEECPFTWGGEAGARVRIVPVAVEKHQEFQPILRQLTHDVVGVLQHGRLGDEPVTPNQIAILTKTNDQALAIQRTLRRVGVPSVLTSKRSVWQSESAAALLALLRALLFPQQAAEVRAVLVGPLFQWSLAEVVDSVALARFTADLADARQRWERSGVLPALLPLLHAYHVWATLAQLPDGDRRIADTRHLLELLHETAARERLTPEALLRWAVAAHHTAPGEAQLRLERDDAAVAILTMHSSKGLQFPIVFLFGAWASDAARNEPTPLVLPTASGNEVTFDSSARTTRQQLAQQELRRLFYVGCTRAERHLTIYLPQLPPSKAPPPNPLAALVAPRLTRWAKHPAFWIDEAAPADALLPRWQKASSAPALQPPQPLSPAAVWQRATRWTSFTALTRGHAEESTTAGNWLIDEPEEAGGTNQSNMAALEAAYAASLPAGTSFGLLVHAFLEQIDFPAPDWALLDRLWHRFGFGEPSAPRALRTQLAATLAADCQPIRLATIARAQTSREHPFLLAAPRLDIDALNALLVALIERYAPAGRTVWRPLKASELRGFLQGVIDLVVCENGRYTLFDYKTNRLPAYDPDPLAVAMVEHHYLLQALLYAVAWDAHLSRTLSRYDPEAHLAGVRFLFVRGTAPERSTGVFACRFRADELAAARCALGLPGALGLPFSPAPPAPSFPAAQPAPLTTSP